MKLFGILLTVVVYHFKVSQSSHIPSHIMDQKLIVVVCDGFQWSYISKAKELGLSTPNFDMLLQNGSQADHLKPVYPSTTYPNLWSLLTGMTVEHHGIVSDQFYDSDLDEVFDGDDTPLTVMYNNGSVSGSGDIEPIWLTNQKAGGYSVMSVWPGGRVSIQDQTPSYTQHVDYDIQWADRINFIIRHFNRKSEPANLGFIYLEEPDETGHIFGPQSYEVLSKVTLIDEALGELLSQLESKGLSDVNLIVASNHGMTPVIDYINLDDFLDASLYDMYGTLAAPMIQPKEGKLEEVKSKLSNVPVSHTYLKEDLPPELHYTYNRRISPLVMMMAEGYMAISLDKITPEQQMQLDDYFGNHAYNNSLPSMWGIFIGYGPAFQSNYTSGGMNILDIYPVMCHILNITPHHHDGSVYNMQDLLTGEIVAEPNTTTAQPEISILDIQQTSPSVTLNILYIFLILAVCGSFITAVCYFKVYRKPKWAGVVPPEQMYNVINGNPATRNDKAGTAAASAMEKLHLLQSREDTSSESDSD